MDQRFRVGEWTVDLQSGHIVSGERSVRVKPMLMRLLTYMAEHAGEVISKRRLVESVWDSAHVTDDALTHSISELRKLLGDDARKSRFIDTMPKRGYRLIAQVSSDVSPGTAAGKAGRLAVMPFASFADDPEGASFGATMTDLLITELARVPSLRVVSGTSARSGVASGKTLPKIARELAVDRVLEGGVAVTKDRVRITVRLLDAVDEHLWAEVYEEDLGDVLAVQREVVRRVVEAVAELGREG